MNGTTELIDIYKNKGYSHPTWVNPSSHINDDDFVSWMERVRKWLRETFQIYVWVYPTLLPNEITFHPKIDFINSGSIKFNIASDSYEDSLYIALEKCAELF